MVGLSIGESETVHLELIPEGEVLVWSSCAATCYLLKMFLLSHLFDMSARDKRNLEQNGRICHPHLCHPILYLDKTREIVDPAIASCSRNLCYLCPAHAILGLLHRNRSMNVQCLRSLSPNQGRTSRV